MVYKRKPKARRKVAPKRKNRSVIRQPNLIADSQIVKLRYVDFFQLDAGIGGVAFDTWRANGIFDPYVGVGGHQPLGGDQYASFYKSYVVLGAKATCYFDVYSNSASDSVWGLGKTSTVSTQPATNINQAIEQNQVSYTFLTSRSGDRNSGKISVYYSPRKHFGLKDPSDNGDLVGITGDSGTDPTAQAYFQFQVGGNNPADNPTPVNCRVLIEYVVKFTERKELTQS